MCTLLYVCDMPKCVCLFAYVLVCIYMFKCTYVCAGGGSRLALCVFFSDLFSLLYIESGSLPEPRASCFASLANQCALRICLLSAGITNSQPHHPDLMCVLKIQPLVFMVGRQVFFLLKYLPSLKRLAFSVMDSCSSESCNGWRLISIPF